MPMMTPPPFRSNMTAPASGPIRREKAALGRRPARQVYFRSASTNATIAAPTAEHKSATAKDDSGPGVVMAQASEK
jgi:hypothetical protein